MPVEIKELIIRAQVSEDGRTRGAAGAEQGRSHTSPGRALSQGELDRIVTVCVERALNAIKRSQER